MYVVDTRIVDDTYVPVETKVQSRDGWTDTITLRHIDVIAFWTPPQKIYLHTHTARQHHTIFSNLPRQISDPRDNHAVFFILQVSHFGSHQIMVESGETLQERTKGKDVRNSNIIAAKVS